MPAIAAMISFYRALGRAPTGGDSNRLHNRLMRLGESPVGAGHARDCRNDQLLSRAWRAPTGGDSNRLHNRLMRLGESPVGAGHARDCRNDQRRAIKVSGLFLSSIC